MASHRALIVDDSKTAQHRLKRMLKKYDLDIDLASSAEEALGYLTHTMPSVIFMDHHMEGMDGLEALKIIKANPSTAIIPVIMYTSQSGDLYVGRAHALGALDILSKEVIKASNLEAVLGKLKIEKIANEEVDQSQNDSDIHSDAVATSTDSNTENQTESATGEVNNEDHGPENLASNVTIVSDEAAPQEDVVVHDPLSDDEPTNLKNQVARLFELHIADVRTQITENTKFMIRRLTSEIKTATTESREEKTKDENTESLDANTLKDPELTVGNFLAPILLALVLIIALIISYQIFKLGQQNKNTEEALLELQNTRLQPVIQQATENDQNIDNFALGPIYDNYEILEVISLATEFDTRFNFNQNPFEDDNLSVLLGMVERLDMAGFRGLIEVAIHTGNFCVVSDAEGSWKLAPNDALLGSCTFSKTQPDIQLEEWTSEAYEQLEILSIPIQQNDIELIFVAQEENPRVAYPEQTETITAGEWNLVSEANNYINIRLESEE